MSNAMNMDVTSFFGACAHPPATQALLSAPSVAAKTLLFNEHGRAPQTPL